MIYNNLILNNNIFNQLIKTIESNTIPNAFLFYGNDGIGKVAHAIEFSAALLCNNPHNNTACSECNSCKKIKTNQHENINFILPLSRKKPIKKNDSVLKSLTQNEIEDLQKMLKEKSNNPYYNIKNNNVQSISINAIREIRKGISLSSFNNSWRINIIVDAEKLCYPRQEAANALLKMLEEPHEKNLFILCSSKISQILDTISSRCLKLYFTKLSNESIQNYLINNYKTDLKKTEIISNIVNGNMILANEILKIYDTLLSDLANTIDIILKNNINEWISFTSKFPNKKYNFILLIDLLELFFSDIIILSKTGEINNIKFKNFIKYMNQYINKYENTDWANCLKIINNCKNNINKNAYFALSAISLLFELNKTFSNDRFLINELESYQL